MIVIYDSGLTYEIDEKELYEPFPETKESESENE